MRTKMKLPVLASGQLLILCAALGWFRQIGAGGLSRAVNAVVSRPYARAEQARSFVLGGWLTGRWLSENQLRSSISWPAARTILNAHRLQAKLAGLGLVYSFDLSGRRVALPIAPSPQLNALIILEKWNTAIPLRRCRLQIRYRLGVKTMRYTAPLQPVHSADVSPEVVVPQRMGNMTVLWKAEMIGAQAQRGVARWLKRTKELVRPVELSIPPGAGTVHVDVYLAQQRQIPSSLVWVAAINHRHGFVISRTHHAFPVLRSISVTWYADGEGIDGYNPPKSLMSIEYCRLSGKVLGAAGALPWGIPSLITSCSRRIDKLSPEDAMLASEGLGPRRRHRRTNPGFTIVRAMAAAGRVSSLGFPMARILVESNWGNKRLYFFSASGAANTRPQIVGAQRFYLFAQEGKLLASAVVSNFPRDWQWYHGVALAAAALGLAVDPPPRRAGHSRPATSVPVRAAIIPGHNGVAR